MKKSILLLLLSTLIISSCVQKAEDRTLVVAYSQEIPNLDVQKNTNRSLRDMLVGSVYERLFVMDGEGIPRCELASSYSFGEDNHVLDIRIRENVNMHDGSVLSPEDAMASMNRWLDSCAQASDMVGGNRFSIMDGALHIESENNLALFPYLVASSPQAAVIASEESLEENSFSLVSSVVGTGPYRLSSYESGVGLTLSRFEDYSSYGDGSDGLWGNKDAYFDTIKYLIVPDSVTRRLGLETGEYDFINDVMSYDIPELKENGDVRLIGGEETGSIALVFNKKSDLGGRLWFRQAVALAVDHDALMKACYGDYGYNLHSDYMEDHQKIFAVQGDPYCIQDMDAAVGLLKENGYGSEVVRILSSNNSNLDRIALALKDMLEGVGMKAEVTILDWTGFLSERSDPEAFDIFISAFSSVALPQMKLYLSQDYPGWFYDDKASSYMGKLNSADGVEEAADVWQEAQRYFWSVLPVVVPGHYITINASGSDIGGVIVQDGNHFWSAYREE